MQHLQGRGELQLDTAEKIGLLPGFGWVAGHGPIVTLLICWAISPLGMIIVGIIGESRWVPLSSDKQFLSFFPGDFFLGAMATGLLVMSRALPTEERWYNSAFWHVGVLAFTVIVAVALTLGEWKSGAYPTAAIFSPTKLYHNGLLYIGYGYVIVTTLVAVVAGAPWSSMWPLWLLFALSLIAGTIWVGLVVKDNSLTTDESRHKTGHAHVTDWEPIWRIP